jgi:hypothetical protein
VVSRLLKATLIGGGPLARGKRKRRTTVVISVPLCHRGATQDADTEARPAKAEAARRENFMLMIEWMVEYRCNLRQCNLIVATD